MESLPEIDIENKEISAEEILDEMELSGERMDDFAVANLNPFSSIEELEDFSKSIEFGKGIKIFFNAHVANNFGEEIQSNFLMQFFTRFFPQAEVYPFGQGGRSVSGLDNVIRIELLDFAEGIYAAKKEKSKPVFNKKAVLFSMAQMKVLHNMDIPEGLVQQLKELIFKKIAEGPKAGRWPLDVPIVVGVVEPEKFVRGFTQSFRYLNVFGQITSNYYDSSTGELDPEAGLDMRGRRLRFLYSLGEYAAIPYDKNKFEGVANGAQIIVLDDKYLTEENPNTILDRILHDRGLISTKEEVLDSGMFGKRGKITQTEKQEIYDELVSRQTFEPRLRESMRTVLDKMEGIKNPKPKGRFGRLVSRITG